jgi:hypothetical protein
MKLKCDRCKKVFEGFRWDNGMTAGYYNCRDDGPWKEFTNPGEEIVCDDCMQSDPRYQKIYGPQANVDVISENLGIVKGLKSEEYCKGCVNDPCDGQTCDYNKAEKNGKDS